MLHACLVLAACSSPASVPSGAAAPGGSDRGIALTIYNQDFAVVRERLALDLAQGVNDVRHAGLTARLEPDSVMLRDPSGRRALRILEQSYRADPVSAELLLSLYEGQTIGFLTWQGEEQVVVRGKIVRSGYVPYQAWGQPSGSSQPIIEVDGLLRFQLPGLPLFPSLADDTILQPTLSWRIESESAGPLQAELAYVTGGLDWQADYNALAPEQGDTVDLIGWVTFRNQSGRTFEDARIKLIAGDVNKLQPEQRGKLGRALAMRADESEFGLGVTEKSFDEFHLYGLKNTTTLRDSETKQVEFVRAMGVLAPRIYVYDGSWDPTGQFQGWNQEAIRESPEYGTISNPKVWTMREIPNAESNRLGIPLPKGRLRFYRQDDDGSPEFVGENLIDHTPKDETLRVHTGNSFDLVGERKRTEFRYDRGARTIDETFEVRLRNHKKEPVEIRVVEHLYRWTNWEIRGTERTWKKLDAQTVEYRIGVAADAEEVLVYTAHYWW